MEQNKIDALRKLGLTKEEAREWIDILAQESVIKTPLSIVYKLDNGGFDAQPFLDLSRKNEVFGVLINDIVWPLTGQTANVEYYNARKLLSKGMNFPSESDMAQVNARIKLIQQTFEILRKNGIAAEDFDEDAVYWTSQAWSVKNETRVAVYCMPAKCRYEYDPSRGKVAYARMCTSFYANRC